MNATMSINTCIYAPNEELKKDAAILAKVRGSPSFSKFVWGVLERMVKEDRERIEEYKRLTGEPNHAREDSVLQRR